MEENLTGTKRCTRCGRELPVTMFYKNKTSKDGLQHHCKECSLEMQKENRKRKKEDKALSPSTPPYTVTTKDGRTLTKVSESCRPIGDFTPRELLAELKRRGYVWKEMYVKQMVDYSTIEI